MKNKITKALLLSSILATSTFAADGGGFGLSQESLSEARKTLKSAVGQINAAVKIVENTIYPNLGTYGVNTQGTTPTTLIDFINLSGSLASSLSSSFDSSTFAKTPYFSTLQIVDQNLYVKAQFTSSSIVDSKSGTSSAVPIFEPFLGKRIILIPIFNITYDSNNHITLKDSEISGWECLTDADGGISNSGISIAGGMRSVVSMGGGVLGSCQYILSSSLDSLWSGSSLSITQCTNDNAGNATWTSVSPGSSSTGTCNSGYIMVNTSKMSRSCTSSNGAAVLEAVGSNGATSSGNFAGCTLAQCTNDSAGNATWTTVTAGNSSTGTCNSNYVANNSSKMSRLCSISNNVASLETVTSGVTASGNFAGCSSAAPRYVSNGWTGATLSSYYQSMFSAVNLKGLSDSDLSNFSAGGGWIQTFFSGTSYYLPSSSGSTAVIDWIKANADKKIVDHCIGTTSRGSTCYGSTYQGNAPSYTTAGANTTTPTTYPVGKAIAANSDSYYSSSKYSSTNTNGLNSLDLANFSSGGYWITTTFNGVAFILPSSAGTTAPIDWFIANPSKRIVDYCIGTTSRGSTCYGTSGVVPAS